jgi:ligand-binding sensor domain-containing protein/anti-sigma regulatory factor (Ser/Thr protein kinase)
MQDSAGYLWFSTRDGLSRYNGYEFTTYAEESGFSTPTISRCLQVNGGDYYVVTNDGGLFRFLSPSHRSTDRKRLRPFFTPVSTPDTLRRGGYSRLYQGPTGTLWGGMTDCIVRDPGGSKTIISLLAEGIHQERAGGVTCISENGSDIWVGTRNGLFHLQNGTVTGRYILGPNESGDLINDLIRDSAGRLWIAHQHLGVIVLKPDTARKANPAPQQLRFRRNRGAAIAMPQFPGEAVAYATADGLTDSNATVLLSGSGGIWIGTAGGLTRFDGHTFMGFTTKNGLSSNIIHSLIEDNTGDLWIGSPAGAMCLLSGGLVSYTIEEGRANLNVGLIGESSDGTVFAIGRDWWVSHIKGRDIVSSRPRLPSGVTLMWASQIGYRDRHDRWWALTSQGLFLYAKTGNGLPDPQAPPLRVFTSRDGLPDSHIFRLYEDTHGRYWIGTRTGDPQADALVCLDSRLSSLEVLRDIPGVPKNNAPSAFAEDSSGSLWIGFYNGGLIRYRGGKFKAFGVADGIPTAAVSDLLVDHAHRLWVSTGLQGAFRIDDPSKDSLSVLHYTKEAGLSSNYIRRLAEDRFGRIYVSTVRGVDCLDPPTGSVTHLTIHDGLAGDYITADFTDSRGDVWFGTVSGLSRLRPVAPSKAPPPSIAITAVRISGTEHPVLELGEQYVNGLVLEPDQRDVIISFSSIALHAAQGIRYQYTISGETDQWSKPGPERTVDFARLAPGNYRFSVRAVNPDGTFSTQPAVVTFAVLPPVWQRWWFQMGAILLFASVLLLLYRWRVKKLREIERMRLAIASDLHDEVATNLSSIAMFSTLISAGNAEPGAFLERITTLATDSVNVIRDIIWSIDPKVETIASLMSRLRDSMIIACRARGLHLTVTIRDEADVQTVNLTPEQRKNLWLMLKEAVTNAIKHSNGSNVNVTAARKGKMMLFTVSDDGKGYEGSRNTAGKGLGTMGMRAGLLGGTMTVQSSHEKGTVVEFLVRLHT